MSILSAVVVLILAVSTGYVTGQGGEPCIDDGITCFGLWGPTQQCGEGRRECGAWCEIPCNNPAEPICDPDYRFCRAGPPTCLANEWTCEHNTGSNIYYTCEWGCNVPSDLPMQCGTVPDGTVVQNGITTCIAGPSVDCGSCTLGYGCGSNNMCDLLPGECESVCGDPHFAGLDGVKYNFMGEPDKTFVILSDDSVQVNSRFVEQVMPDNTTNTLLGDVCIRACNETVSISGNGRVVINGNTGLRLNYDGNHLFVNRGRNKEVVVEVPGKWQIVVAMLGKHTNINRVEPRFAVNATATHGVLGHTLQYKAGVAKPSVCNSKNEGGCEVAGDWRDYELADTEDLCSTRWKHSAFSCSA